MSSADLHLVAVGCAAIARPSHVDDPASWLAGGHPGTSTRDTFRTWSTLATAISVIGLAMVLLLRALAG